MFVKAQALRDYGARLFDKLILDSGLLSAKSAVKSLFKNPALCYNPLSGDSWWPTKAIVGNKVAMALVDYCCREYSIEQCLPKIDVPVLFIRGSNNTMVSEVDFQRMFDLVKSPKVAFITPFHHSNSFGRAKGCQPYVYCENLFIKNSFEDFAQELASS